MLLASACSTKSKKHSGAKSGSANSVKTDIGVTASTITLGVLTDLSGVFAVLGKSVTQGAQLYFTQLNQKGGVCKRQIKLNVKDDGYDVQKAVGLYADMQPNVLGFEQLLGSPINAALKQNIESDKAFTVPVSWASTILDNPNNMIVGTTYDVELINGIQFLVDQGKIKKGDTVGHIYLEGEYGADGYLGSQFAAKKLGLKLVGQKVTATATDLTSQVTALKNQGVKAIMLTATPTQTASAAAVDASTGLNVPLLGNNPVYAPQLLATAAGPALTSLLYVAASWQPYSGTTPGATAVRTAYSAKYPKEIPNGGVDWGYGAAAAYTAVLKKACDNGDLTRDGVQKAFRQTTSIDTNGILPSLDYSHPGDPATRETLVSRPDKSAAGGLKVVQDLKASDLAKQYVAPEHGKGG
ncbi:MAG: ABC transporter substrate-binding protein [Jatrophihabitans sp.]|uniref:ABC transporter substrate-binding protein n=1 Tax=Jatrophihabitans sp. TaxID=1932789 RepID=UPI00391203AB